MSCRRGGRADPPVLGCGGQHRETFAGTDGRPLGFAPDKRGNLLVADAVRGRLARLPAWLRPGPVRYAHVLGLDENGRVVVCDLCDPEGGYAPVSSARQHGDWLYLGSLTERAIGRVAVPRGCTGPGP